MKEEVIEIINELTDFVSKVKRNKEIKKRNEKHPIVSSTISNKENLVRIVRERDVYKQRAERLEKKNNFLKEVIEGIKEKICTIDG